MQIDLAASTTTSKAFQVWVQIACKVLSDVISSRDEILMNLTFEFECRNSGASVQLESIIKAVHA